MSDNKDLIPNFTSDFTNNPEPSQKENFNFLKDDKMKEDIKEILSREDFQNKLKEISITTHVDLVSLNKEAKKHLESVYARHDKVVSGMFIHTFKSLIDTGFENNIDIDYDQLRALVDLMNMKSVALVSSHKSYLDLIILFIVLGKAEIKLPYIFSGDNLRFPVIGDIVKKSGIIFIKRTQKDDLLYKMVLKYFINWLLEKKNTEKKKTEKTHFVWSIEGGRSRTGKLSEPKLGILKYLSETDIEYVPVSIVYDLIPDLDGMLSEIHGKSKKQETLDWLVGYFRKIGLEKCGKISIRFGNPIKKQTDIYQLSQTIMKSINDITPVTTISLICIILINNISADENTLKYIMSKLVQDLNLHHQLTDRNRSITHSVNKALELLEAEDIIRKQNNRYIINHYKYFQALYYANLSIHHFYYKALVEMGLIRTRNTTKEQIFWQEINKLQPFLNVSFEDNFKEKILSEISKFSYSFDNHQINEALTNQALLVSPLVIGICLDSYRIVSEVLFKLVTDPTSEKKISEKDFINQCLFLSEEMYWLRKTKIIESTTSPYLQEAIQSIKRLKLWPGMENYHTDNITSFINQINECAHSVDEALEINLTPKNIPVFIEDCLDEATQEILNGEKGSHIGAFFDLDKTLIKGYSLVSFAKNRLINGKVGSKELLSQLSDAFKYLQSPNFGVDLNKISITGLKDISEKEFLNINQQDYLKDIQIYDEAYTLIEAHRKMCHTICIISAATQYQVQPIAAKLKIEHIECSQLEVLNGRFTGKFVKICWGEGKAEAGRQLSQLHHLDLSLSYFYTDSSADIPLLKIVGKPRPVNPDIKLMQYALDRQIPTRKFESSSGINVENIYQTGLTYSYLIPALIRGYTTNGVTGALTNIADVATSVGGIILNVKGEENLWKRRPAVFIFNHQSYVDMIVVIKLIKRDVTAIAKKEVRKIPIFGDLLEEVGVIFIDLNDKSNIIEALKPAVEGLRNGTSLVVFPEGTRSFTKKLGPFKKGAFHMAMQAHVPIIPVIIQNSNDIMPRGTSIITPGILNVSVLEPILTDTWSIYNLSENIERIRSLYLTELNQ